MSEPYSAIAQGWLRRKLLRGGVSIASASGAAGNYRHLGRAPMTTEYLTYCLSCYLSWPCSSLPASAGAGGGVGGPLGAAAPPGPPRPRPKPPAGASGIFAVPPTFSAMNWVPVANPTYCVLSIM